MNSISLLIRLLFIAFTELRLPPNKNPVPLALFYCRFSGGLKFPFFQVSRGGYIPLIPPPPTYATELTIIKCLFYKQNNKLHLAPKLFHFVENVLKCFYKFYFLLFF